MELCWRCGDRPRLTNQILCEPCFDDAADLDDDRGDLDGYDAARDRGEWPLHLQQWDDDRMRDLCR